MDKIIPKTAIIISSSVIAVLLIISGWLGYQNRGIVPLTEQTGDNYESDYTYPEIQEPVISELSPTDVAKPVSETDNISNDENQLFVKVDIENDGVVICLIGEKGSNRSQHTGSQ